MPLSPTPSSSHFKERRRRVKRKLRFNERRLLGIWVFPPLSHTPLPALFWGSKPRNQSITLALLPQGTSWAVADTQAFLTQVRFPLWSLLLGPLGSLLFPNSRKSPFVEFGLFFVTWIFLFFLLDLFCSALLPPSLPPLTLSLDGSFLVG